MKSIRGQIRIILFSPYVAYNLHECMYVYVCRYINRTPMYTHGNHLNCITSTYGRCARTDSLCFILSNPCELTHKTLHKHIFNFLWRGWCYTRMYTEEKNSINNLQYLHLEIYAKYRRILHVPAAAPHIRSYSKGIWLRSSVIHKQNSFQ